MTTQEAQNKLREILVDPSAQLIDCQDHLLVQAHGTLKFEHLAAISALFGTEAIDIGSDTDGNGCSSCGYGANSWIELSIYDAKDLD